MSRIQGYGRGTTRRQHAYFTDKEVTLLRPDVKLLYCITISLCFIVKGRILLVADKSLKGDEGKTGILQIVVMK